MNNQEYISQCVLCCGSRFEGAFRYGKFFIVRCKDCGLLFVNPRASEKQIREQYISNTTSPFEYYRRTVALDRLVFRKRLALIEKYFPKGRLLDVGCSVGTFLETALEQGWNAEGIEANLNSARYCQIRGLHVSNAFFEESMLKAKKGTFDVIHMGDVVEHFQNPVNVLQLASSLLKKRRFDCCDTQF